MNKIELRKLLIKTRLSMRIAEWQHKNLLICQHLAGSTLFGEAKTVLAYFSIHQEPDLSALFALHKTWGFPRCVNQDLRWHRWSLKDCLPLQRNTYGILEPEPNSPEINAEHVDLILVPAIACDQHGYRLGYGGGFYDRLLSQPTWATKPTIGIVFDFARVPLLPRDSWDQPLRAVCTEAGLFSTVEANL